MELTELHVALMTPARAAVANIPRRHGKATATRELLEAGYIQPYMYDRFGRITMYALTPAGREALNEYILRKSRETESVGLGCSTIANSERS